MDSQINYVRKYGACVCSYHLDKLIHIKIKDFEITVSASKNTAITDKYIAIQRVDVIMVYVILEDKIKWVYNPFMVTPGVSHFIFNSGLCFIQTTSNESFIISTNSMIDTILSIATVYDIERETKTSWDESNDIVCAITMKSEYFNVQKIPTSEILMDEVGHIFYKFLNSWTIIDMISNSHPSCTEYNPVSVSPRGKHILIKDADTFFVCRYTKGVVESKVIKTDRVFMDLIGIYTIIGTEFHWVSNRHIFSFNDCVIHDVIVKKSIDLSPMTSKLREANDYFVTINGILPFKEVLKACRYLQYSVISRCIPVPDSVKNVVLSFLPIGNE
jgi:hypothetical protein